MPEAQARREWKFNAIIVDPNLDSRMRLKQATAAVPQFGEVAQNSTLQEAIQRLDAFQQRCDVIFISYRFEQAEVAKFVAEAKKTKYGQDAAYVLVLKSKDQDNTTVAETMLQGVDGFLFEPYSVDTMLEMTRLATRVRCEREAAREKLAVSLMMGDIIKQLDFVAFLKASGVSVSRSLQKLREMCVHLQAMPEDTREQRWQIMIDHFIEAKPPPKGLQIKSYTGVSSRVRAKMEEKLIRRAEGFNLISQGESGKK